MTYTYQSFTDSGNFASPDHFDVEYAHSMKELKNNFSKWLNTVRQYSELSVSFWVVKGYHETIEYPDFIIQNGKLDGIVIEKC